MFRSKLAVSFLLVLVLICRKKTTTFVNEAFHRSRVCCIFWNHMRIRQRRSFWWGIACCLMLRLYADNWLDWTDGWPRLEFNKGPFGFNWDDEGLSSDDVFSVDELLVSSRSGDELLDSDGEPVPAIEAFLFSSSRRSLILVLIYHDVWPLHLGLFICLFDKVFHKASRYLPPSRYVSARDLIKSSHKVILWASQTSIRWNDTVLEADD